MKAVILAGGLGSRLSEETTVRPKPLVEIGGRPILWHIMKIYSAHGINDFVICCGYKGHLVKEYFANYFLHNADVRFDLKKNRMDVLQNTTEPWTVTLVDTGEHTMTGGRLKRVRDHLSDEPFCLTYGDGVSNVDLTELVRFHRGSGCLATLTAVQPPGRYGSFDLSDERTTVERFVEKPVDQARWINGGFFVLDPRVIDYIEGDATAWEDQPLARLAGESMLSAYRHRGFWASMDTLREKIYLEQLWSSGLAPWKVWP